MEEGCERDPVARDLCGAHYQRRVNRGLPLPPKVRTKMGGTQCIVDTCIAEAVAHGLCPRHARRSSRYGLVAEELETIDAIKACQVCGAEGSLHVDHCHDTLEIRGVLCGDCNKALGLVKDSPETLIKLAAYLIRSREAQT